MTSTSPLGNIGNITLTSGNHTVLSWDNQTVNNAYGTYTITDPSITTWFNTSDPANSYWPPIPKNGKITADEVTLDGLDVKETILALMKRLAILENPDPKKLEKFAALKQAYEHYKTLEALCYEEDSDDKNNG